MSAPVFEELQSAGLRATIPRVKVLEFFRHADHRHFSAEDVFRHLVEDKVDIGLATVYRVLAQLEEAGLLTSGMLDSSKVVYELNEGKRHDHIICLNCGKVDEFSDPLIDARQKAVADALGYMLTGHQLVLHGYCAKCRPKPHGAKPGKKA
ncbi:ferric iron uptake transcriptional regulator [Paraburkholderia ferrariae]|uniref:ferric iron uptake transcriptional regulator n=1 Tax=Paraburkholderia ferrariae TaxID=386056 RepID=UPI0004870B26|nr:ferric iron uptake transcriptional regulator [Paraburkholderia ferrariae]